MECSRRSSPLSPSAPPPTAGCADLSPTRRTSCAHRSPPSAAIRRCCAEGRPLEQEPVDLQAIATDAVADARVVAPQRDIKLTSSGTVVVNGDDTRLRQVLANLVRNAIVHTPVQTPIDVNLSTEDSIAKLSVADHGPGLSAEEIDRIFEPFYRADPSRSRDSGGAGLGLSIVSAVVTAHGGHVKVHETDGGGATFEVELPLAGT